MFEIFFASRKRPYIPHRHQRDRVTIDLSGSKLSMTLMPHGRFDGLGETPIVSSVNVYDTSLYKGENNAPDWKRAGISCLGLGKRFWELRGPVWREQSYGHITFSIVLIRSDALPASMSCFNPAHFEQLMLRAAYYNGPGQPEFKKVKAPINWRLLEREAGTWIYYEAHPDFTGRQQPPLPFEPGYIFCYLCVPIGDRHYVRFNFRYHGYAPVETCFANMNPLREAVCDSIQLTLSPTAQTERQRAQTRWPQARAQRQRNPEPWGYPEWRDGDELNGEPDIVILKPGSPPPALRP